QVALAQAHAREEDLLEIREADFAAADTHESSVSLVCPYSPPPLKSPMPSAEFLDEPMGKKIRTRVAVAALAAATFVGFAAGPGGAAIRYRVRPGDTLTGIAKAHGTTIGELARLNRLDPEGILFAGVLIRLPDSVQGSLVSYRVQPGDTLRGIAVRWGTSVLRIAQLNRIDPAGLLLAGKRLVLPRPAATAPTGPADPLGIRAA